MDSSNPFGRKIIDLDFVDVSPTLTPAPKRKKKKLSSDLLKKKLNIKAERGFHKDMKKAFPIDSLEDPVGRSSRRKRQHSRRVDIRKTQEEFKAAKKSSRKAKK